MLRVTLKSLRLIGHLLRGLFIAALAGLLLMASGRLLALRAPTVEDQIQHGFDLAYNLDHEQALDAMKQAAAQDPTSSGAQRALAVVTWLNLLFTRGTVLVDDYLGPVTKKDVTMKPPPTDTASAFRGYIARGLLTSLER